MPKTTKCCNMCENLSDKVACLEYVLASLVYHMGYKGENDNKYVIHAGYIPALKRAFAILKWEDPMMAGEARVKLNKLFRRALRKGHGNV